MKAVFLLLVLALVGCSTMVASASTQRSGAVSICGTVVGAKWVFPGTGGKVSGTRYGVTAVGVSCDLAKKYAVKLSGAKLPAREDRREVLPARGRPSRLHLLREPRRERQGARSELPGRAAHQAFQEGVLLRRSPGRLENRQCAGPVILAPGPALETLDHGSVLRQRAASLRVRERHVEPEAPGGGRSVGRATGCRCRAGSPGAPCGRRRPSPGSA